MSDIAAERLRRPGAVELHRESVGRRQDVLRDQTLEKRVSEQRIEDVGDRADEDELVGIRRAQRGTVAATRRASQSHELWIS